MIDALLIGFREGLEATLITSIILAYLKKTERVQLNRYVYLAAIFAILASILIGILLQAVAHGVGEESQALFEGTTILLAVIILTTMIFWMWRTAKHIKKELERKIEIAYGKGQILAFFSLVFVVVFREGIETVLFLYAISLTSNAFLTIIGGVIGIGIAALLGLMLYLGSVRIDIKRFFSVTSIIIIIFAAGLTLHAVHEFNEAGVIPPVIEHIWDTSWIVSEDSVGGAVLHALTGYMPDPSLTAILGYVFYWIFIILAYLGLRTRRMEGFWKAVRGISSKITSWLRKAEKEPLG